MQIRVNKKMLLPGIFAVSWVGPLAGVTSGLPAHEKTQIRFKFFMRFYFLTLRGLKLDISSSLGA